MTIDTTELLDVAVCETMDAQKRAISERVRQGSVDDETLKDLESGVITLRKRLLTIGADERDLWEEAGIDEIPHDCGAVVEGKDEINHFGVSTGPTAEVRHPPFEKLDVWSDSLLKIAAEVSR